MTPQCPRSNLAAPAGSSSAASSLALVAVWLFSGGMLDRGTAASIDGPDNVRIEVPDVDVDVTPAAPAPAPAN